MKCTPAQGNSLGIVEGEIMQSTPFTATAITATLWPAQIN